MTRHEGELPDEEGLGGTLGRHREKREVGKRPSDL